MRARQSAFLSFPISTVLGLAGRRRRAAAALVLAIVWIGASVLPVAATEDFPVSGGYFFAAQGGSVGHGYTYGGHPVGCAVALKTLEIYERDDIYGHAADVGEYLQKRLRKLADHELIGDVRGVGLIGAVELVADKATGESFARGRSKTSGSSRPPVTPAAPWV